VAGLQARILDLKAQAGSVVIRFTPGSRQVPVTASLGTGFRQPFIIDTGASMVTIPSETARDLGLIVNVRTPRRTIYTAGGVITAPEVVVPSIAIDDWEVRNVKALVVDLPDNLGWGLLGMNYLRRFRMDLNTDEGLLLLEPR
jgi:aspartyl protease family protein